VNAVNVYSQLKPGIIQPCQGSVGLQFVLGALPWFPQIKLAVMDLVDVQSYDRKVMILKNCLTLTRLYHEQGKAKRGEYYADLANQYYSEILGLARGDIKTLSSIQVPVR
jgi:hypothetical protein